MSNSAEQVILVLQVVLTIGPLAVYFLGLGLVSSQARPCLVSERSDFVLLATAFVPVICWPIISLITGGRFLLAAVLLVAIGLLFFTLLPRRHAGWVIYNISSQECRRALQRSCARLGWRIEYLSPTGDEPEAIVRPENLTVTFGGMPWLRNMTLRFRASGVEAGFASEHALVRQLSAELQREAMLPSPTGAGLVVIGAAMLGLPMWYLFSNVNAIVDVLRRMLLA